MKSKAVYDPINLPDDLQQEFDRSLIGSAKFVQRDAAVCSHCHNEFATSLADKDVTSPPRSENTQEKQG